MIGLHPDHIHCETVETESFGLPALHLLAQVDGVATPISWPD